MKYKLGEYIVPCVAGVGYVYNLKQEAARSASILQQCYPNQTGEDAYKITLWVERRLAKPRRTNKREEGK